MFRRTLLLTLSGVIFFLVILPAILVKGCAPMPAGSTGLAVSVFLVGSRRLVRMGLENYLSGVVAAEMPANFPMEALKAQAIAARTLTVRRLRCFGGRGCKHLAKADICDQAGDGQAWLSDADLKKIWGRRYKVWKGRVSQAIVETAGLVMLYDHRPIEAVYHSTCGGMTEDAANVWGRRIPYLASVTCGYDRLSPRCLTVMRLPLREFARRLELNLSRPVMAGSVPPDLHILGRTASGRVTTVRVEGRTVAGPDFRTLLGLRSANFTWRAQGTYIVFDVRGYGHGVGLCQYGAQGMARQGAGYLQILRHYYTGVSFGRLRMSGKR